MQYTMLLFSYHRKHHYLSTDISFYNWKCSSITKCCGTLLKFHGILKCCKTPVGWLVVYLTALFSVTRLYSIDDRMISEWLWVGKALVGSGHGLILRYYPGIRLEGLRKTTRNLNQGSQSTGLRIKLGTSRMWNRSVNHSTTTFGNTGWESLQ
jgi:hypothetical protein